MKITAELTEFDVRLLDAYKAISDYDAGLTIERLANTKTDVGYYDEDIKMLFETLVAALKKARQNPDKSSAPESDTA